MMLYDIILEARDRLGAWNQHGSIAMVTRPVGLHVQVIAPK
jgi:hypothetical protein